MTRYQRIVIILIFIGVILAGVNIASHSETAAVYKIPVSGEIDPGMVKLVKRGIEKAEEIGAANIIIQIDTYGGLVDSAIKIKDAIFDSGVPVITFVDGRAWSAGALIALAGDNLVMISGSSIGAAETRPLEEKYISALRKEFKATAESRGRNSEIAAAMVDVDIVIEDITESGKLLTLTAGEAEEHGICELVVNNINELLSYYELTGAAIEVEEFTSTEKIARVVTNPAISTILLTLGFLALLFEALIPGWGAGGTVGLLSLGLFFSSYIINGYASWGLVILFVVGIILLALEVFVVPGFGFTGIGGIIAVGTSLYFMFPRPEVALSVLATVMILSLGGSIIMIKIFGGSRFWKNISLGESQTKDTGYVAHDDKKDLQGQTGTTITPLRPTGTAEINGERMNVVSEGGFVDSGQKVEVIEVSGSRIVVKPIPEESE